MPYAANYDIVVDRGAVFQEVWTLKDANGDPVDLSAAGANATFSGQVTDPYSAEPAVIATFDLGFETDGTDGQVYFALPVSETLKLKKNKSYRYDIFIRFGDPADNDFVRILEGELEARMNSTTITPA